MERYIKDNLTILFYQKEGEEKYSFCVEGNEILSQKLLFVCKHTKIRKEKIKYAISGIFDKLEELKYYLPKIENDNPIIKLNELSQKLFKHPPEFKIIGIESGEIVQTLIKLFLPDGEVIYASARNQKEARRLASVDAIEYIKGKYNFIK